MLNKELKLYLWLILALVLFWFNNSYVDTAMWHQTYNTPIWVSSHLDIIWLALGQVLLPFLIVIILKPKWNTVLAYLSAIFIGGVLWDLNYSWLTRGTLISDSPKRWFALDDFGLVIGIPQSYALLFHVVRIIVGIVFLLWLISRTQKNPQ